MHPIVSVEIRQERDIVAARQRARQLADLLGFDAQDQTRIATAVSEVARNAFRYAGGGTVRFSVESARGGASPDAGIVILVEDKGPGIADLAAVLEGRYRSETGMGLGLVGAKRLMDSFAIESQAGQGTSVRLGKWLPMQAAPLTAARLRAIGDALIQSRADDPVAEFEQQNKELLRSLEELRLRQDELTRLNAELADTNRGVLALYAELDERAEHLRRADETKTRFLSSISHELRTPINSIVALSRIVLERMDGDLTAEQEKQVSLIRRAAENLGEIVDDLLDLAKVEAGKTVVRPEFFAVADLFGTLRGMIRPLLGSDDVALTFSDPAALPPLWTDQGKVAQILRNFLSNALKFTEQGSVQVSATMEDGGTTIVFSVRDTGIGIAAEDQKLIFEEFGQIENRLQRRVKGTGLGLPLSRKLATLLGGTISLESTPGIGSVFSLAIPRRCPQTKFDIEPPAYAMEAYPTPGPGSAERILIVDDDDIARYALRQFLSSYGFELVEASSGGEGLRLARQCRPALMFLDLGMPDMDGFQVLHELKTHAETKAIPVVVFTSMTLEADGAEPLASADAVLPKKDLSQDTVAAAIQQARGPEVRRGAFA